MRPWLELTNVTKSYGSRKVLDRVTISVREGEIFTLLGPSGTGKSTLLKAVAGLVVPDAGSIQLAGRDITSIPPQERNVGLVFQDYSLFPSMSLRENVAFPLVARHINGLSSLITWRFSSSLRQAVYNRTDEVLGLVHLSGHAHKRPSQLSGGEQQRAALARALAFDPDLLCLDEPFSALDKNLRQELQQQIRDLQSRLGKTMLYVTHDQSEAMLVSTRIGILHKGVIEQTGSPEEVYCKPASAFVARFLGDCNILPIAKSEVLEGRPTAQTAGGTLVFISTIPADGSGMIAIRPEKLHLTGLSYDGPGFVGTIEAMTFLGSQFRYDIRIQSGERIRVIALANENHPAQQGDRVCIRYNPSDISLIPSGSYSDSGSPEEDESL